MHPKKSPVYPDSITMEQISIEPDKMDLVSGDEMSNMKRLKEVYDVDITLLFKGSYQIIISIEGMAEMVFAAKKDIEEGLSCTKSFYIETGYIYRVIGREGKRIRNLEKEHGVQIGVRYDGKVVLTGHQGGCKSAKEAIESLIERGKNDKYREEVSVPKHQLGYVCGKNSLNLKKIESKYSVQVILPSTSNGRSQVLVIGPDPGNVSAAKKHILSCLFAELSLDVDKRFVETNCILGRGRGETLWRLSNEYRVHITCSDDGDKIYVSGVKMRAEAARDAILSIISDEERRKADVEAAE